MLARPWLFGRFHTDLCAHLCMCVDAMLHITTFKCVFMRFSERVCVCVGVCCCVWHIVCDIIVQPAHCGISGGGDNDMKHNASAASNSKRIWQWKITNAMCTICCCCCYCEPIKSLSTRQRWQVVLLRVQRKYGNVKRAKWRKAMLSYIMRHTVSCKINREKIILVL